MILIEIPKSELNILKENIMKLPKDKHKNINILELKKFDGSSEFIQALIPLATFSIPFVTKIFIECIRQKKHFILKYQGFEISGLSEKNMVKVLNKLLEEKQKNKKGKK